MSNEQKKQTIALWCHIKNEHDFINPWIEYYITLGVNHFYIGIDNSISIQDEYILHESLKEKVTFFYIEKMKVMNAMTVTINSSKYFKNIKEDWVIMAAPDMYYYNNGKNLVDLINSTKEECGQIILPNIFLFNSSDSNQDNFLQNISKYKYNRANMINTIVRTKCFKNINAGGHTCSLKNKNICKIECEYKEFTHANNHVKEVAADMAKKTAPYTNINHYKNGVHLHFMLRSIDEAFIKDYFQWTGEYSFNINIQRFKKLITCKDFNKYRNILLSTNLESKRCKALINSKKFSLASQYFNEKLKIPSLKLKNETKKYDKLINILLKEANLSKEEYSEWKKSLIEYLK